MKCAKKKQKKPRRFLLSFFGFLVVAYFLYHTIEGERGWFAMLRLQREISMAEDMLLRVHTEKVELEKRANLLKDEAMDPDLLDEKSRELLNYSKPGEIIILVPPKK